MLTVGFDDHNGLFQPQIPWFYDSLNVSYHKKFT